MDTERYQNRKKGDAMDKQSGRKLEWLQAQAHEARFETNNNDKMESLAHHESTDKAPDFEKCASRVPYGGKTPSRIEPDIYTFADIYNSEYLNKKNLIGALKFETRPEKKDLFSARPYGSLEYDNTKVVKAIDMNQKGIKVKGDVQFGRFSKRDISLIYPNIGKDDMKEVQRHKLRIKDSVSFTDMLPNNMVPKSF